VATNAGVGSGRAGVLSRILSRIGSRAGQGHLADPQREAVVGDQLGQLQPGVHLLRRRVVRQLGGHGPHRRGDAGTGIQAVEGPVNEVVDDPLPFPRGQSGQVAQGPDQVEPGHRGGVVEPVAAAGPAGGRHQAEIGPEADRAHRQVGAPG